MKELTLAISESKNTVRVQSVTVYDEIHHSVFRNLSARLFMIISSRGTIVYAYWGKHYWESGLTIFTGNWLPRQRGSCRDNDISGHFRCPIWYDFCRSDSRSPTAARDCLFQSPTGNSILKSRTSNRMPRWFDFNRELTIEQWSHCYDYCWFLFRNVLQSSRCI